MKTLHGYSGKVRSLIIDDEVDICFLLGNILKRKNILNDYTTTLADGKQILNRKHFDFIVLDNYLPDGKGIDFIRYVKTHFPRMKIIMITAFLDTYVDKKHLQEGGIDYLLLKPLNTDSINQAIDQLLNTPGGDGVNN